MLLGFNSDGALSRNSDSDSNASYKSKNCTNFDKMVNERGIDNEIFDQNSINGGQRSNIGTKVKQKIDRFEVRKNRNNLEKLVKNVKQSPLQVNKVTNTWLGRNNISPNNSP